MSLDVLRQGIDWDFETFAEYLAQLRASGSAVNLAAYVGHSSVRTWVMGADASRARRHRRRDRADGRDRARRDGGRRGRLRQQHQPGAQRRGRRADAVAAGRRRRDMALVEAMGEGGRGVYMVTKGGQMPVAFLESMAARSGRPVMVAALLHNGTNPQAVFDDLDAITAANTRGRRLIGQVSCCPLTMDFTLASPYPVEGLASWKPALGVQGEALKAVLATRVPRRRARRAGRAGDVPPVQRRVGQGAGGRGRATRAHRAFEQRSIAEIAAAQGRDPLDVDARPRARRRPAHGVHRAVAQQRRRGGRPDAQPPAQPRLAERRGRAPDLLQRRRLRPAPARPLGARARRDGPGRRGAPPDRARARWCSACATAA